MKPPFLTSARVLLKKRKGGRSSKKRRKAKENDLFPLNHPSDRHARKKKRGGG